QLGTIQWPHASVLVVRSSPRPPYRSTRHNPSTQNVEMGPVLSDGVPWTQRVSTRGDEAPMVRASNSPAVAWMDRVSTRGDEDWPGEREAAWATSPKSAVSKWSWARSCRN